jgi:hypothetical protein
MLLFSLCIVQTAYNVTQPFDRLAKPLTNYHSGFEDKPLTNRPSGFEAKPMTNHRPWFCGLTKKPTLLFSLCIVQTAHSVTASSGHRVPDLCLIIPDPLHQVSYSYHDPYRCPPCHIYHLHTTRQANMILQMKQR